MIKTKQKVTQLINGFVILINYIIHIKILLAFNDEITNLTLIWFYGSNIITSSIILYLINRKKINT